MNCKAFILALVFICTQVFAFGASADIQYSSGLSHTFSKKSGKENGKVKSIFSAFEVEEDEESGFESLKKVCAVDKIGTLNSTFSFLNLDGSSKSYFTSCVSGFRHVRIHISIRSIRI